MTTLLIVRHAQSTANDNGIFVGHTDAELSELGFRQAQLLADYLVKRSFPIDKIYSSDLLRPYHTVEPYARAVGKEIITDKGLREIYAGAWEGQKFVELYDLYPVSYRAWKSDIGNSSCDGGESVLQLYDRINSEVDRIASENDGRTLLVGTHATPLRAITARAVAGTVTAMQSIPWCENTSINIFEFENGRLSAKELNISEHLGTLRSGLPSTV